MASKPKYIDLYAGCGGLSLGLMRSGWKGMFAVEKDAFAFATLRHNLIDQKKHFRCFWHDCPKHSRHAAKSGAYWRKKLKTNRARDRLVTRTLRREGWRVLRIWEHELVRKNETRLMRRIQRALSA